MDVRQVTSVEELRDAIGAIGHYFGGWPTLEQAEHFGTNLPLERMHAAFDGEKIVGGAGAFPFELTIPGGQLRCGGVTVVGVLPTHRRRGVLTSMMRAQLEDIRDRGEPLAALWASEEAIYRRYGYGMAALGTELTLARGYQALRPPANTDVTVRLVSLEEAKELVPPIYERTRLRTPGMYARSSDWWETRILDDPPDRREDGAAKNVAIAELAGVPAAYALYRVVSKWEGAANAGHVRILEAMGDDGPELELWRFLLGLDWVGTFRANHLPIDHPLLHALVYPRRAPAGVRHALRSARRRRRGARRALLRETRSRSCSSWRTRSCRRTAGAGGSRTAAPSGRTTRPIWRSTSRRPPRSISAASARRSSCVRVSSASCAKVRRRAPTGSSPRAPA